MLFVHFLEAEIFLSYAPPLKCFNPPLMGRASGLGQNWGGALGQDRLGAEGVLKLCIHTLIFDFI